MTIERSERENAVECVPKRNYRGHDYNEQSLEGGRCILFTIVYYFFFYTQIQEKQSKSKIISLFSGRRRRRFHQRMRAYGR